MANYLVKLKKRGSSQWTEKVYEGSCKKLRLEVSGNTSEYDVELWKRKGNNFLPIQDNRVTKVRVKNLKICIENDKEFSLEWD